MTVSTAAITLFPPTARRPILAVDAKPRCSACSLRSLCLPTGLAAGDWAHLDAMIATRRRVRKGETLYQAGDEFTTLYAVRLGSFKATVLAADGRDQVTNFHLAGEIVGFDGVDTGEHRSQIVALEDSEVCLLPFDATSEIPQLQQHFLRLLSREVTREHQMLLMLGNMRAEERLAAFLLTLSERYRQRGFSALEFVLRMRREEIGSYLGLKIETVSRLLTKFQEAGLIHVQHRTIKLLDSDGLRALIGS